MIQNRMNRNKWDKLANDFEDSVCDITSTDRDLVIHRLMKKLPRAKEAILVDLGCGIGTFIQRFGSLFSKIIGSDFSSRMIDRAKEHCKNVANVNWIVADLPDAAKQLGPIAHLTVCMNVITSVDVAQRKAQWTGVKRVTKPGGRALIVIPSLESAKKIAKVEAENNRSEDLSHDRKAGLMVRSGDFQKHYTRSELHKILTEFGFTVHGIKRVYYPWAEEGLEEKHAEKHGYPWDWLCYIERPLPVRTKKKKATRSRLRGAVK